MNKEMIIKGVAIAVIGGLFVKNIFDKCKDAAQKNALEAEYKDLGYEEVNEDE